MGDADPRPPRPSGVNAAKSKAATEAAAAADICGQLPADGLAMVLIFLSPHYDPNEFMVEVTTRLADVPVYGCTTAGELSPDGWDDNSVVALGFAAEDFTVFAQPIFGLSGFRVDEGRRLGNQMRQDLSQHAGRDDDGVFGLVLIDGMCQREEAIMSAIYASLDNIPLVGGSAGDGLRFERTWVFHDGKAHTDMAVLILIRTSLPFRLFKCDNFEPTSTKMVVTEADLEQRIVKQLNAEPAAEEYCRAIGIADSELDPFLFAAHPVLVRVGGSYFARSIQRVSPDGSLRFFCAIDEGMVLTAARSRNSVAAAREMLAEVRDEIGEVSIFIGFECILRRLDAEQHQFAREMSDLYRDNRIVGFHTYGEQYGSMHVNQTLTGVAIGKRGAAQP
ncbi:MULTISPECIES: FIST N-terminal domain-containing protein [unclassified Bradyrhizobium]|uniref:FIST N-terminal domain-containing protein n=1 Tax=unclassified Bradyrhizobium TaxID=2631580 RepID=UPI002915D01E|nr:MULTISPECIES: FIST N-terminal domain-containing protein [unclassified Bradyrhizobium]